jgi:hypothetical protein
MQIQDNGPTTLLGSLPTTHDFSPPSSATAHFRADVSYSCLVSYWFTLFLRESQCEVTSSLAVSYTSPTFLRAELRASCWFLAWFTLIPEDEGSMFP